MTDRKIQIQHIMDHYEVWVDDSFFCSADTYMEAIQELEREGIID